MKKRCDNPYGDIASVVALARANEKVPVLHLCICDNKECGKFFKSRRRTTKYCHACSAAVQKERHQKWLKKSKEQRAMKQSLQLVNRY